MNAFGDLFKDKELSDIEQKISDILTILPKREDYASEDSIGKTFDYFLNDPKDSEVNTLLQSVSVPQSRLSRYAVYDEAVRSIPLIRRILKVYIPNILPKNPVDNRSIIFKQADNPPEDSEEVLRNSERFYKHVFASLKLSEKLKNIIVPTRLLYGDCFVEVVDCRNEFTNVTLNRPYSSMTSLTESVVSNLDDVINNGSDKSKVAFKIDQAANRICDNLVMFEFSNPSLDINDVEKLSKEAKPTIDINSIKKMVKSPFSDILIRIHKPHNIIILSTKYGTVFGYVEVEKMSNSTQNQSLSTIVNRITTLNRKNESAHTDFINRLIYITLQKIVSFASKNNIINSGGADIDSIIKSIDDDVYVFMKRLFVEQGLYDNETLTPVKVRFIPESRMVQFSNPSFEYYPYGESVIESLIMPGKLYLLSQLTNIVSKLSRAAVVRKWTIDVGSTQMHSQLLQKWKRELYNTRISLDDISNIKSIPKILTDYKDMVIFSKQGQVPINLELQSFGDTSIDVQDLEDARRELIALSGIPATYLGYNDQIELRDQLVHINVAFATEISDMQEQDTKALNRIVDIIGEIKDVGYIPSDYMLVSLIPPVVLTLQLIEMTLSSMGNIFGMFMNNNIKYDPYYFLKRYVPQIDWDESERFAKNKTLDTATATKIGGVEQPDAGGQPGGGMGGQY